MRRLTQVILALFVAGNVWAANNGPSTRNGTGTGIAISNTAVTTCLDPLGGCGTPYTSVSVQNCNTAAIAAATCTSSSAVMFCRLFQAGATIIPATVDVGSDSNQGFPVGPTEIVVMTWRDGEGNPTLTPGYASISCITSASTTRATFVSK